MHPQRRHVIALGAGSILLATGLRTPKALASAVDRGPNTEDGLAVRMRHGWLGRVDVQEFIYDVADRNNLPRTWIASQFEGLGAQPRALQLMNPPPPAPGQPVRKRSWARYLSQHADITRVRDGRKFMGEHQDVLADVAKRSGVPANVITAIIGVETKYGQFTGRFPTLETLTTLAFESPRRTDFFRRELESLLIMGRLGVVDLKQVRGSFAGALGLPQFMPSSWRNYAVGYRDPARPDLINRPHDAIASIGNFLKAHGWKANMPSHDVAVIPAHVSPTAFVAPKLEPLHTVEKLQRAGISQKTNRLSGNTPASLIDLPEEDDTVTYWIAANNFFVVTQYNRSFMYAAAVLTLAEALDA